MVRLDNLTATVSSKDILTISATITFADKSTCEIAGIGQVSKAQEAKTTGKLVAYCIGVLRDQNHDIRWDYVNYNDKLEWIYLDINTPEGLLNHLLVVNEHGVWFVKTDDDRHYVLPKWLWGHCKRALPGKGPKSCGDGLKS